jgi:hypothetical protein
MVAKDIVVLGYGGKFKPLSVLSHQAPGGGGIWLLRTLLSLVTAGNSNHFQFFPRTNCSVNISWPAKDFNKMHFMNNMVAMY